MGAVDFILAFVVEWLSTGKGVNHYQ